VRWFPWISREHHESVIAAKNDLIRSLEVQNAVLAERLAEPVKVTVEIPRLRHSSKPSESPAKDVAIRTPKKKPLAEIDFSTLDPRDMPQMAALAVQEFGTKLPSPMTLDRWYTQVRMQINYAQRKKKIQADQTGSVGTIVVEEQTPVAPPETPQDVPQHIIDLVAAAERGE
jgi:hypothetical protein